MGTNGPIIKVDKWWCHMSNNPSINILNIDVTIQSCIIMLEMYIDVLLLSCCTRYQCLTHLPLLVGNDWMHYISLWLVLQPNCWDISLAYFLLNDLENACFYCATTWIIYVNVSFPPLLFIQCDPRLCFLCIIKNEFIEWINF